MKIVYEFTEADKELLKNVIPKNPCDACSASQRMACCGCAKQKEWSDAVEQYDDAHILDTALKIRKAYDIANKIKTAQEEFVNINNELPDFCKVMMRPDGSIVVVNTGETPKDDDSFKSNARPLTFSDR